MPIIINGSGIDMGGSTLSNASQINSTTINENGDNVATTSNLVGFKNYIINGNFDIWQYKDAGVTYPQTSSGYGSDDRWSNANVGSTKTHSQVATTDTERVLFNASFFSRTVVTSVAGANNYVMKQQKIENITKLAGKTVTLSFWVKADSNKKIGVSSEIIFGTGGSPSSQQNKVADTVLDVTTTWQKKTVTFTVPSIVGKTIGTDGVHTSYLELTFWFDAGTSLASTHCTSMIQQSGTFDIAQVQLEEGSVATPFENRPVGLELSLCQRYYEVGNSVTHVNTYAFHWFAVPKRLMPTVSSIIGTPTPKVNGFILVYSGTLEFNWTASAEI